LGRKEEIAEYMAKYAVSYYEKNKEEILIRVSNYKKTIKKETAKTKLEWRLANPGKYAGYCAKRRAIKLKATLHGLPNWIGLKFRNFMI